MTSNVYHVHFMDDQLPPDPEGKARFAREYSERLTGLSPEEMTCLIQPHNHDASCRVTITVPQRHREAIRRIEESGLEPAFSEPEQPILEDNACILPSTFQILHFGGEINPDRGMYLVFPASGWQIIFGSAGGPGRGSGSNKTLLPIGLVPS